jgi:DNA-binding transcriptional LysR family regulator
LDTDLLKTFLEVQRTRHFGKAAENLYLTQSAVSFRIRQLEQQLGVNLFIRHRNNIQLTAAGERLLPHAQTMLAALQKARQDVANSVNEPSYFQLGVSTALANTLLAAPVSALPQLMPELNLRLDILGREQLNQQLLNQQLDLALLTELPKTAELYIVEQGELSLIAVCQSKMVEQAFSDRLEYCYLDWGNLSQQLAPDSAGVRIRLRTNSYEVALQAVLQQPLYAYLPALLIQTYLQNGQLHQLTRYPALQLPYYLVCHQDRQQDALIKQLSQQLLQRLGAK